MSKSIAYIGVSSPLAYDYANGEPNRPNPILEAPMGLFLLYDELRFLHPALCPRNMRDLEYVTFISDSQDLGDFREAVENRSESDILEDETEVEIGRVGPKWGEVVESITPESTTYDNHGRTIDAGLYPNASYGNFVFDQFVTSKLNDKVDYVPNSRISRPPATGPKEKKPFDELKTTEQLLSRRIPNYQSPDGPYFEKIDDFRNISTIKRFRRKMRSSDTDISAGELDEEFERIRNQVFVSETDESKVYRSVASLILHFVPGASELTGISTSLARIIRHHGRSQNYGWANFLARVEQESRQTDAKQSD